MKISCLKKPTKQQNTENPSVNVIKQKNKHPGEVMDILFLNIFKCTSLENSALVK